MLIGLEMSMVVADVAVVPFFDVYAVGVLLLHTNDHLEFLTAILTVDTEEGLLQTATIIL